MVPDRLRTVGLKVKPAKCELVRTEVQFLDHLLSEHGIKPIPDKIEINRDWPTPRCIRDATVFYGLASYYRTFIKNLRPLQNHCQSSLGSHNVPNRRMMLRRHLRLLGRHLWVPPLWHFLFHTVFVFWTLTFRIQLLVPFCRSLWTGKSALWHFSRGC